MVNGPGERAIMWIERQWSRRPSRTAVSGTAEALGDEGHSVFLTPEMVVKTRRQPSEVSLTKAVLPLTPTMMGEMTAEGLAEADTRRCCVPSPC